MSSAAPFEFVIPLDFNGTLLNDVSAMAYADQEIGRKLGLWDVDISVEMFRSYSGRNWRISYESLAGRPLTNAEVASIDTPWHEIYFEACRDVSLHGDAVDALELIKQRGGIATIISMHPDESLQRVVDRHGIRDYFTLIDGLRVVDNGGESKTEHLDRQLKILAEMFDVDERTLRAKAVIIGDNIDDARAGQQNGIGHMLVTTGEMSEERIAASGFQYRPNLTEAVTEVISAFERTADLGL